MAVPISHVAHILPWKSVGGTEQATLRIARLVSDSEFRHTAFCPAPSSPVQDMFAAENFQTATYQAVEPSFRHPRNFLAASYHLARELRRREIDLVHCSDLLAGYYATLAGKLARVPVLCHVRCSYPDIAKRHQRLLSWVDRFAFVSNSSWETFGYKVSRSRGVVIYDGVELGESSQNGATHDNPSAYASVRSEFGIPEDAQIVGMVSRVAPAKDYVTLIQAAKNIVNKVPVRFLIAGDYSQVPLNHAHYLELKEMITSLGLDDHFIFTDHRDDVTRLIEAMDVFVLSTHTEGLPLVVLEAMARAKPVVATNVGGVPEIIQHGQNGLLTDHGDPEMLARHVLSLLNDETIRQRLGKAGRESVERQFNPTGFAAGVASLYREMLGVGHNALGSSDAFTIPKRINT